MLASGVQTLLLGGARTGRRFKALILILLLLLLFLSEDISASTLSQMLEVVFIYNQWGEPDSTVPLL